MVPRSHRSISDPSALWLTLIQGWGPDSDPGPAGKASHLMAIVERPRVLARQFRILVRRRSSDRQRADLLQLAARLTAAIRVCTCSPRFLAWSNSWLDSRS